MARKKSRFAGENNPRAKLTNAAVLALVRAYRAGNSMTEISKVAKVCISTVSLILSGKRWSKVTGIRRKSK